jgi:hypothetical protein
MNLIVTPDGDIKKVSNMVAELLIYNGGRRLELKPIELNINNNEGSRSIGTGEVPKPRKRRINRRSEGKIYSTMDKK